MSSDDSLHDFAHLYAPIYFIDNNIAILTLVRNHQYQVMIYYDLS